MSGPGDTGPGRRYSPLLGVKSVSWDKVSRYWAFRAWEALFAVIGR